jgi:hypothetical protein
MRKAEQGASQVPLVICIVLLLVAGFFAYTQYGERQSVEAQLNGILAAATPPTGTPATVADVKDKLRFAMGPAKDYRQRLEEILVATGGSEDTNMELVVSATKLQATTQKLLDSLDRGNLLVEFPVDVYKEEKDGGVKINEGAGGKVVVSYVGSRELRGNKPDMTNVLEYVVMPAMTRMVYDIRRLVAATAAANAAKDAAEAAYKSALAAKDAEIKAKGEELATMDTTKSATITDLRRQVSDAEAAKAAAEAEKTTAIAALTKERDMYRSEAEKMSGSVKVLKDRKRAVELDTSPDGSVLSVGAGNDFVVIDLGKSSNNLMPGTVFDVYAIGKGGMEIHKGSIKVTKTDTNSSECRTLDIQDAFNPIAPGDKIRSVFYSPKETIHVALVGRFSKMGKSDAARRLTSLGVVVDEKVTTTTTYLVVGAPESEAQPIEETVEYKAADLYGIPHITERELSRFTMY